MDPSEPRATDGKSRLLLKRYFSETTPKSLPVGYPTVTFSEGRMHHSIRVITDEAIDFSSNLLQGVLKEHRDNTLLVNRPTTAPTRDRALTPHRNSADTSEDGASRKNQVTASSKSSAINSPADLSGSDF